VEKSKDRISCPIRNNHQKTLFKDLLRGFFDLAVAGLVAGNII
jgi:hypothetical protein